MRILLYDLVETEDSLEVGPGVGELLLGPEGAEIHLEDEARRARLAVLLQGPLPQRVGDPSGRTRSTRLVHLAPDDPGYLPALLDRLEHRDLRLHGVPVEG